MKIAFIGHSFHQKTKSTQFFIDILKEHYDVDFYWTLPSLYQAELPTFGINATDYKALLFFQILPTEEELKSFRCKNIVLIPMYDNDVSISLY